jgi:hypothetical protein
MAKMQRTLTFSDFQDGAAPKENDFLHSLSMIARGNNKRERHTEKSMNDVRHSVGLYMSYPLANGILAGATKRYANEANSITADLNLNLDSLAHRLMHN